MGSSNELDVEDPDVPKVGNEVCAICVHMCVYSEYSLIRRNLFSKNMAD